MPARNTSAPTARRTGRVLVVDDNPANRLLLQELLEPVGHHVVEAADGRAALELAITQPPDVVLLDVQMPGLDGFEVCRRLKANEATAAIPVVFVTALDARSDRIAGVRAGASEFLSKPVDRLELVLRVGNAIAGHSLFLAAQAQYRNLQDLEAVRDAFVHLLVHDLRSPLSGVLTGLELMQMRLGASDAKTADILTNTLLSTRRLVEMVSDVLDVSRMEEEKFPLELERVDLNEVIAAAIHLVPHGEERVIHVDAHERVPASADRQLILRVVINLIDNALKFAKAGDPVTVAATITEREARVSVSDSGPGVPPEARSMIFEKFGQVSGVKQTRRSSGLGLSFCKLAVEAHGGAIGVESDGATGSEFWFSLPVG